MKIIGSPDAGGRTQAVVRAVLEAAARHAPLETDLIVVGNSSLAVRDGTRAEERTGDTRAALDALEPADLVVPGTPVYRATYSSILKTYLDLVPRGAHDGSTRPLQAKPVGVVAPGAFPHPFPGARAAGGHARRLLCRVRGPTGPVRPLR